MNDKGLIPSIRFPEFQEYKGWELRILGDIGEFIGGGTPDTSNPMFWNGNIPWYTPTEVKEGSMGQSIRSITIEGFQNSSAKLLPKGALLITTRATIGDIAIAKFECTTNQGFQNLVVKESEINTFWYYWIICNRNELLRKSSGSTFPEIGKSEIIKIKAYRPESNEQQKIAACLSSLDEVIAAQSEKLEALKAHKKGLMQNLFPQEGETVPKFRFPEFAQDGEWEKRKLADISVKIQDGTHFSPKSNVSGDFLYITSKNVKNGYIELSTAQFISKEEHENIYNRCDIKRGDVLLTKDGTIGQACVNELPIPFSLLSSVAFIRTKPNFSNYFLYHLLVSHIGQKEITSQIAGQALKRITLTKINNFSFSFPPLIEQQKIATCLSALDASISAQTEKIDQLKQHKQGLMQGLFPKMEV